MMTENGVDILICGAGAAGLTLAIELARRGVDFHLIDKLPGPFPGSRGKGLQPRTLEVFDDLGVVDRIYAAGGPYPALRHHRHGEHRDGTSVTNVESTATEPYGIPVLIPQFATERVLRERLLELGQRPRYGCELVELRQDAAGVSARVRDAAGEHWIRARYLVGADGGRSTVREHLGIPFPGQALGVRAVVADVAVSELSRDAWHQFGAGVLDQISLCPLPGTQLFQIQAPVPMQSEIDLSASGLSLMLRARSGDDRLCVRSVQWASMYQMSARLAEHYRVGHCFLAGDAAHVHPPTGGQGLNTSVQDAYNLGWKLATVVRGGPVSLLDSYEAERRPVAKDMVQLATRLLDAAKRGDTRRGREVRQLDLAYLDSPLNWRRDASARVGPGERAPDAPLCGAGGQPRRVFDLLRGTHWTLLGRRAMQDALPSRADLHIHVIGEGGDLFDEQGVFDAAYGLADDAWVLVRPDGYIGAVAGAADLQDLNAHLARCGIGPTR